MGKHIFFKVSYTTEIARCISLLVGLVKATTEEQFLSQGTRDLCLKRLTSPVCGRQRREIFVARDENVKSNMFDIYNNGLEIFISCDKNRSCAVFGDLFLKLGIS